MPKPSIDDGSDEVRLGIDVVEGVRGPAVRCQAPLDRHQVRLEPHVHIQQRGELAHTLRVLRPLVVGGVRDHERGREPEAARQLDRVLDALALDDPRRLEGELLLGRHPQGRASAAGSRLVERGRERLEVDDVGDDARRHAPAPRQACCAWLVLMTTCQTDGRSGGKAVAM